MEILYVPNLMSSLSLALLTVSPMVFIFSVTLLGTAIEQAQQEEKAARENDKESLQKEIVKIEQSISQAKKDGNAASLTDKLEDLKKQQIGTEEKIREIKVKYSSIDLVNCVLYPCGAFLFVVLISPLGFIFYSQSVSYFLLIISEFILVVYGVLKIYRSLTLVQQISTNKKEGESYSKIKDSIKLALQEYDQSKSEEAEIKFIDKVFPLNVTVSTELEIKFKVGLKRGRIVNDMNVWFFVPDGFELINPSEEKSWKQSSDYSPPNIRTVKVSIGNISIGPFHTAVLVIKTPEAPGKYTLKYQIHGQGYEGPSQEIRLLVG